MVLFSFVLLLGVLRRENVRQFIDGVHFFAILTIRNDPLADLLVSNFFIRHTIF